MRRTKDLYSERLINLLLNVKSDAECKALLNVVDTYEGIDRRYIEILRNHYSDNTLLMASENMAVANEVFKKFGLPTVINLVNNSESVFDSNDLPF